MSNSSRQHINFPIPCSWNSSKEIRLGTSVSRQRRTRNGMTNGSTKTRRREQTAIES
ncbi:MAG: hypothetical protein LBI37_02065 [Puniceicoccales bacterium]|nr:hypothetical protein [Puniceicoccales bacterium]